jgi:isoleucyl-tRNA synthetase
MSQNYKDTLLLPKTNFPMKADLVVREPERLAKWEAAGLYERVLAARKGLPKFVLHDGPPFANGDVHMGTALNKVLKDLIVKSRSMAGFEAPFVPGWDCHGLPIEFKVVKESRGLAPAEIRRRSEEYARKFIEIQRGQFKRLGVLGDWQRPYLTLDPGYEAEILRAFAGFVEKGLVYQSRKPVYWSTGAQTALAEAEVEYADRRDPAIHVAFKLESGPLAGRADAVIWTTTPWTLPANVAIALHPRETYSVYIGEVGGQSRRLLLADKLAFAAAAAFGAEFVRDAEAGSFSGLDLNGSEAAHPFLDRRSRLIVAEYVTMDSGTGLVHTAPGHGSDDYISGVNNGLPILSPVDEQGRYTAEVGVEGWEGKYVFDANADVIALLRGLGVLLAETAYEHSYPHCWRSKTPVVFRAVEQFFIRVDAIRGQALRRLIGRSGFLRGGGTGFVGRWKLDRTGAFRVSAAGAFRCLFFTMTRSGRCLMRGLLGVSRSWWSAAGRICGLRRTMRGGVGSWGYPRATRGVETRWMFGLIRAFRTKRCCAGTRRCMRRQMSTSRRRISIGVGFNRL